MRRARIVALMLACGLLGIFAPTAQAQTDEPPPLTLPSDDEVNAIARNMYCPVCENVPLDVCPTLACQQWRDQIREKLSEGWNEEQIHDYFVVQYGDRVLAAPPRRGLNWLIYTMPWVLIALGGIMLGRLFRRLRATAVPAAAARPVEPPLAADDYVARIEEELKRRDRG